MILSFWLSAFIDLYRAAEISKLSEQSKEDIMLMYIE